MSGHRLRGCEVAPLHAPPRRDDGAVDIDEVVRRARRVGPVHLLHAAPGSPGAVPWTYVVPASPFRVTDDGAATRLDGPTAARQLGPDPLAAIDDLCEELGLTPDAEQHEVPFSGGLVGTFAYDLGRRIERIGEHSRADRPDPHVAVDVAEVVVAIDHRSETAYLVTRPLLTDPRPRADALRAALGSAPSPPQPSRPPEPQRLTSTASASTYQAAVARALGHIAAGDVFQVNVAHRLTGRWGGDAHALYGALASRSPAPHGAVLDGAVKLASVSPETFLVADGRHVRTRPIKGTRPRGATPAEDRRLAAALEASPKDRAENVMVVDMERNDLGRVCETGSVHVPGLLDLEAHPTVWHLVSTIDGTLRPGVGWGELLRATFPCGSITGTPKVRAMQLIEQLEPVRRGHYCGAIGWLGAGGMRLSVSIRTAVLDEDGRVDYAVGAGIVADSDPAGEYAETLAKAAAFVDAVNGVLD